MRIAFVIPGGGGGGVRSVLRIATGLIQRGHVVTVFHRREQNGFRNRLRSIYLSVRYGHGRSWLAGFAGAAQAYEALTADLVRRQDVVIGVGISSVLEVWDLPDSCGIKVHNSRGVEPWCDGQMKRAWSLPMPRIVVGSHLVPLMRQAGSTDPIFVAPNGIETSDYYPSVAESARDGIGVVYHGAPVKDPELVVGVLRMLALRRPNLPLYVFGTYPRPTELPARCVYVRFPSLSVARSLYSRSVVWFMGSRNEGFGNPLLEAAGCGCALVSTDCGGATDIIQQGTSGLIVPVGDVDAMVGAIESVLDDKALCAKLRNGASEAARRFSWDNAIARFEEALDCIVSDQARCSGLRSSQSVQSAVH